ncbi:AMP deaminase [Diplonema papillatum]|nr:AMP deaminase [Diplonema papillatum]
MSHLPAVNSPHERDRSMSGGWVPPNSPLVTKGPQIVIASSHLAEASAPPAPTPAAQLEEPAIVRSRPGSSSGSLADGSLDEPERPERKRSLSMRLKQSENVHYHRIDISNDGAQGGKEMQIAAEKVSAALDLREKYQNRLSGSGFDDGSHVLPNTKFWMDNGVVHFEGQKVHEISYEEYVADVRALFQTVENGPTKSICRNRLKILDEKYSIYIALNSELEENRDPARKGGGVFSNCVKVDNSVRLSTAMHPQDLLNYITDTYETSPDTEVGTSKEPGKEGEPITLRHVFTKYDIGDPRMLTVEGVGLHPPVQKRFHRFDIFSKDFNRGGERSAELLKMFLKRDGPFYHNIIRPILVRHDAEFSTQRVATEYKLPIFGRTRTEWAELAEWVFKNDLGHKDTNQWIIQIPRIKALRPAFAGLVATTQEQLDNIFLPLWAASLEPDSYENRYLSKLLVEVGAFNVISDEQVRGQDLPQNRPPHLWPWAENPPDLFFNYYVYANLVSLNHLRRRNDLNTFTFRPNSGEQGKLDQLVMGYVLAASINHGITMERSPVLQYLFYLSQVGIVLSPLASNGLGNPTYLENPFHKFQKRGMKVSLGTDDPLHYHHSRHPCIEEYGTASKLYKLGPVDMVEIARNSVLISGFPDKVKQEWLGVDFLKSNDSTKSFVPDIRLLFREDTLNHERKVLRSALQQSDTVAKMLRSCQTPSLHPTSASSCRAPGTVEEDIHFTRIDIINPGNRPPAEKAHVAAASQKIAQCLRQRKRYVYRNREKDQWLESRNQVDGDEFKADMDWECLVKGGVYRYKRKSNTGDVFEPADLQSLEDFFRDFNVVHDFVEDMHVKTLCHRRLQVLEHKFALHMALNIQLENQGEESRDFYQAPKVDTHIHAAAGMTARQLLEFIVDKAEHGVDDVVKVDQDKNPITLGQLLKKMNITPQNLSVDSLNVQADATLFERFDNFNDKYNPMGNPDLRNLLLKTDNYMGGRYFAEIAKLTFAQYQRDEYTYAEMRLSIYGRNIQEWTKLAAWFDTHGMACNHNKWMVQIPRIYPIFRKFGAITSFQGLLTNIFEPLWQVSFNPASDPKLHHFLKHMSGFDSVDNESTPDIAFPLVAPTEWTSFENPPYGYWMYFMWANIKSLNTFRAKRGLSTFTFRPHCGESGSVDHLMFCYLTADHVNHGVNLRLDPVLEYLYYLSEVGIAVSPLSNNSLFLDYLQNPFPQFFRRGLYVSLSTDDPLQFHHTQEPLIEEYSIASKVWKLNANDMCEIARNSVMQSGFDFNAKVGLVGNRYLLSSSKGNLSKKSHLSDIRVAYRFEAYHAEIEYLEEAAGNTIFQGYRSKMTLDEERGLLREVYRTASCQTLDSDSMSRMDNDDDDTVQIQKLSDENKTLKSELSRLQTALAQVSENLLSFTKKGDGEEAAAKAKPAAGNGPPASANGQSNGGNSRGHPDAAAPQYPADSQSPRVVKEGRDVGRIQSGTIGAVTPMYPGDYRQHPVPPNTAPARWNTSGGGSYQSIMWYRDSLAGPAPPPPSGPPPRCTLPHLAGRNVHSASSRPAQLANGRPLLPTEAFANPPPALPNGKHGNSPRRPHVDK